ncbi:MAG TPA: AAA family ATPase, partial [Streptosporangiaceae bacterium]|nr:AAA family ATPase [Streptosporangiaceae bacterium]
MRRNEGSQPAMRTAQGLLDRFRETLRTLSVRMKIALSIAVLVVATLVFADGVNSLASLLVVAVLSYGPVAVWRGHRSVLGSVGVAVWGFAALVVAEAKFQASGAFFLLLALLVAVVAVAHQGVLAQRFVPCRTVAWALVWSVPFAMATWWLAASYHVMSTLVSALVGWVLAMTVLLWRLAKGWQETRAEVRQRARAGATVAPYASKGGPGGGVAARRAAQSRQDPERVVRAAEGPHGQIATLAPRERAAADPELPTITVDEAMAELDAMIGLEPVKGQIRQLTASVEAARRRASAGLQAEKPMQHFVFLGPPGTGKTTVARIIAKIYYAFGLLESPNVVEAQRADLVGEYLGATAIKTNELIDSALGGVLLIDEAYSLVNEGDGHGDRFGNEAVQALLKRAEDERDNLIVILAGYERQMEDFLASNPGLNSRFAMRIKFPGYSPGEMMALARAQLARRGESLGSAAAPALARMMEDIGRRRLADELGNGRFVRSLVEKAGQARDVRVMSGAAEPTSDDL